MGKAWAHKGPEPETVKVTVGFVMQGGPFHLRIESLDGTVIGELETDRVNLGDLLAGTYGMPATWTQWRKK